MSQEPIESKLLEQFNRLFRKESFKLAITEKRGLIGIPIKGFVSNGAYLRWLKKDRRKFSDIQSARADLARQFRLPFQHSQWIEAYLLLDQSFKIFDMTVPFNMGFWRGHDKVGFLCALEFDKDDECIKIQILPGASYRGITRYLHEHKKEIQEFLSQFERRVELIREKRKAERDALVYACFKKGWLRRDGSDPKAIDGSSMPEKVKEEVRKIDIARRQKIINEQIKMRK